MKYILKNIKSFFLDSKIVSILTIVSVFVSAIVINFSYGIYQNYNIVLENETSEGELVMSIIFMNNGQAPGEYVTQEMFMECVDEIASYSSELEEKISVITANALINGNRFDFRFGVRDNEISISDDFVYNSRVNGMISGAYWGDMDERKGSNVALCYDYRLYDNLTPYLDSIMVDETTLIIDDKEYEIIGYQSWSIDGAMIPIRSIDNDTYMENSAIMFDRGITKPTYDRIAETFNSKLGDLVYILELPTLDRDSYYTYRTVIIIAALTSFISALNFMILYKYIMSKRKKKTAIYRLCGMTSTKASFYNLIECLMITIPLYLAGTFLYDKIILPSISKYFPYMLNAYTNKLYGILFSIYIGISFFVCVILVFCDNRKKILEQMKG